MSGRSHRQGNRDDGRRSAQESGESRLFAEEDAEFKAAMEALSSAGAAPDKDEAASRIRGATPHDVPSRQKARRKEQLPEVAARLDLHGSSVEEALVRLEDFIVHSAARDLRRVLVITGRGLRSSGGVPVLRRAMAAWLRREGRPWVRGVTTAPPHLGGEGALDVNLRRQRAR